MLPREILLEIFRSDLSVTSPADNHCMICAWCGYLFPQVIRQLKWLQLHKCQYYVHAVFPFGWCNLVSTCVTQRQNWGSAFVNWGLMFVFLHDWIFLYAANPPGPCTKGGILRFCKTTRIASHFGRPKTKVKESHAESKTPYLPLQVT